MNVIEALTALKEGKKIAAKKMALSVDSYVVLDKNNRIVDASGKTANITIFTMDDEFMIYETEEDKEGLLIKGKAVEIWEFCKEERDSESCLEGTCPLEYYCNNNQIQDLEFDYNNKKDIQKIEEIYEWMKRCQEVER